MGAPDEDEGFPLGDEGEDDFAAKIPDATPAQQTQTRRRGRRVATVQTEEKPLRPDGTISSGKPWTPALEEERMRFPKDLDLLFPAVVAWIAKVGRAPGETNVQAIRLMNAVSATELKRVQLEKCRLDELASYGDPTEATRLWVTETCHRYNPGGGACSYLVRFLFLDGAYITECEAFNIDPIAVVDARRQAQDRFRAERDRQMRPVASAPYVPPPSPYAQTSVGAAAPAPQVVQAPAPAPAVDYENRQLAQENAYLKGKLDNQERQVAELLAAAREGRQPNIVHPAPATGQDSSSVSLATLQVLERIVDKLNAPAPPPIPAAPVGVGAPAPVAAASPVAPASAAVVSTKNPLEAMAMRMFENITNMAIKKVEREMSSAMTGGAAEQPGEGVAEVVEPDKPDDAFRCSPVGDQTWPDGSKVVAPLTPDGDIDWSLKSLALTNPFLTVKAMDIAGKATANLMDSLSDIMRRAAAAGQTHVVSGIPAAAQQAGTPTGVGAPAQATVVEQNGSTAWPKTDEV